MKKMIALTMLAGLLAVGCAHDKDTNRDMNRGGTSDTSDISTGSGTSTTKMRDNPANDATSKTSSDGSTNSPALPQ